MMVNHKARVHPIGELNGHEGYEVWNESTEEMSIHCGTCHAPGRPYGGNLQLDRWNPRRRDGMALVFERHADPRNHPVKGQRWLAEGTPWTVTAVSETYRWASLREVGAGRGYRWPLPLPDFFTLAAEDAAATDG